MGHDGVGSGYSTSTSIPRVDGLSTGSPGFGASQLGIGAYAYDYLGLEGYGLRPWI